jgi:AAA15 family ATPase/GTPase
MIIEFTVGNFLSFKEKRTISFEARGVSELKGNVVTGNGYKLLRSLVIYGANSSGKSNVIKAFGAMRNCVLQSVRLNDTDKLDYSPFLLSSENKDQPTFFEIIFLCGTQKFRYGFEYNSTEIVSEWLFTGKGRNSEEKRLFIRTLDGIDVSDCFKEGKDKEAATNKNRLFLSLVAQLNGEISKQVIDCFVNYNVLSGISHQGYGGFSLKMFDEHLNGYENALSLFQKLHLGFNGIEVKKSSFNQDDLPENIQSKIRSAIIEELRDKEFVRLNTVHNVYDGKGKVVRTNSWEQEEYESEGTKKIIDLSGPIFDTLLNGGVLIVDELDAKLHPLITMHIINLFNNPETNSNAQLLFATHDTNLLSSHKETSDSPNIIRERKFIN